MKGHVGGPERLRVYLLAQEFADCVDEIIRTVPIRLWLVDQLRRASESTLLNIAEGAGHFARRRKTYHYQTARASATECISILTRIHRRSPVPLIAGARRSANMICTMLTALIQAQEHRPEKPDSDR